MAYNISKRATLSIRSFVSIIIIIILLFVINNTITSFQELSHGKKILEELNKELEDEKKQQAYLKERLSYVKTDKFIEEEVREKLGLVKEGEYIVIAPAPFEKSKQVSKNADEIPNWKKWWKLFF